MSTNLKMVAWFSLYIFFSEIPKSWFLYGDIFCLPPRKIAKFHVPVIITISNLLRGPFSLKIPNPSHQISQILDPKKPIEDPPCRYVWKLSHGFHWIWALKKFEVWDHSWCTAEKKISLLTILYHINFSPQDTQICFFIDFDCSKKPIRKLLKQDQEGMIGCWPPGVLTFILNYRG